MGSLKPVISCESHRAPSPNIDAAEQAVLEQEGLVTTDMDKTPDAKRPVASPENEEGKDHVVEKDKLDRGKIRRSLHRTLREAHVPSHTRSRKGKDSSSSAGMSEEGKDDVLSRGTGSFVVHGKKASVITFGSEIQSMSNEERLRLRKQPHKDEPGQLSPATIDDDFHSVLAEPYEFHERHDSQATTSTATARSFRDLHRKLASHSLGPSGAATSDGEDSDAAISFSEGRRTPLPPVEDEEGYTTGSRPVSQAQQAMFYTPEASNSPAMQALSEKNLTPLRHDDGVDLETRPRARDCPHCRLSLALEVQRDTACSFYVLFDEVLQHSFIYGSGVGRHCMNLAGEYQGNGRPHCNTKSTVFLWVWAFGCVF